MMQTIDEMISELRRHPEVIGLVKPYRREFAFLRQRCPSGLESDNP
jgi:hypothetical protein